MSVDPPSLRIQVYPTDVLRAKADPIDVTPEVVAVAHRMIELMIEANGLGLAAPQVGLPWQMFVCDVPEGEGRSRSGDPPSASDGAQVFVNPEILSRGGDLEPFEEGCLSLPDITGDVIRPAETEITATALDGSRFTSRGSGLLARCWQHEFDHLNGVLILDRMTQASRLKVRAAVRNLERQAGRR